MITEKELMIACKSGEGIVYTVEGQTEEKETIVDRCGKMELFNEYSEIKDVLHRFLSQTTCISCTVIKWYSGTFTLSSKGS